MRNTEGTRGPIATINTVDDVIAIGIGTIGIETGKRREVIEREDDHGRGRLNERVERGEVSVKEERAEREEKGEREERAKRVGERKRTGGVGERRSGG